MVCHIQSARTLTSNRDEIAFEQYTEMLGYGRPAHVEAVGDIAGGALSLPH
jgi:hypothetical protein